MEDTFTPSSKLLDGTTHRGANRSFVAWQGAFVPVESDHHQHAEIAVTATAAAFAAKY